MPSAPNVTARSQMEQSARVGGGCSQVVQHDHANIAEPRSRNASQSVSLAVSAAGARQSLTVSSDRTGSRTHSWSSLPSGLE